MDQQNISDTFLAATLVALGFKILQVNKENPQRCVFLFETSPILETSIQEYLLGKLRVNPSLLFQSYKYVLSLLHDHEK